jgi:hypothetical protein
MKLIIIILTLLLAGCSGNAYLFSGFDYAGSANPICGDYENGNNYGKNDALTSNLGAKYVVPVNDRVNIIGQYTHHSCVNNNDKALYDGFGIIMEVKLW